MYLISSFYPDSKSLSLCMQHAASCIMHHADADHFLLRWNFKSILPKHVHVCHGLNTCPLQLKFCRALIFDFI